MNTIIIKFFNLSIIKYFNLKNRNLKFMIEFMQKNFIYKHFLFAFINLK
jgi:hypothetical protein